MASAWPPRPRAHGAGPHWHSRPTRGPLPYCSNRLACSRRRYLTFASGHSQDCLRPLCFPQIYSLQPKHKKYTIFNLEKYVQQGKHKLLTMLMTCNNDLQNSGYRLDSVPFSQDRDASCLASPFYTTAVIEAVTVVADPFPTEKNLHVHPVHQLGTSSYVSSTIAILVGIFGTLVAARSVYMLVAKKLDDSYLG